MLWVVLFVIMIILLSDKIGNYANYNIITTFWKFLFQF